MPKHPRGCPTHPAFPAPPLGIKQPSCRQEGRGAARLAQVRMELGLGASRGRGAMGWELGQPRGVGNGLAMELEGLGWLELGFALLSKSIEWCNSRAESSQLWGAPGQRGCRGTVAMSKDAEQQSRVKRGP